MISTALTAERCVNNEKHADKIPPIFRWSNAKDCNIKEYGKCSAVHLDRIHISDSCTCTNSNCSNRQHISDIDNLFDDICIAFRVSSLETITRCKKHSAKTTLYLDGMIMLRKRTLKLDITIFYGVIWTARCSGPPRTYSGNGSVQWLLANHSRTGAHFWLFLYGIRFTVKLRVNVRLKVFLTRLTLGVLNSTLYVVAHQGM